MRWLSPVALEDLECLVASEESTSRDVSVQRCRHYSMLGVVIMQIQLAWQLQLPKFPLSLRCTHLRRILNPMLFQDVHVPLL